MDWGYIARQATRYEQFTQQWQKLDCLHRIASHANLFEPDVIHEIDQSGWTTKQQSQVLSWLKANKKSIEEAIAQQQELQRLAELEPSL